MKKIVAPLILISLLINCQDSKESLYNSRFSKNTGEQISVVDAERWTLRHRESNKTSKVQSFGLNAATFRDALMPSEDKLGALLYYATDNDGMLHVLFVPVTVGKSIWSATTIVDTNDGSVIDSSTAQEWTEKYKLENPQGALAHFFGIYALQEILFKEGFEQMDIIQAIDDNGLPQLLLYVWATINSNGRTQGEELTVYDKSGLCPPCEEI